METLECIKTRRSKRKFLNKEVPQETIEKIIDAGKCAPSSHDGQPWKFYIIKKKQLKEKLAAIDHEENQPIILACDFILLICVDTEKSPARFIEDGVLAAQNMSLAIHDLGLGCVYFSAYKLDDAKRAENIREILSLPEKLMPIAMLPTGYFDPKEKLEPKNLKDHKELIEYC